MGEIRIVGPGKTRGYPYPVCKNALSFTYTKSCFFFQIYRTLVPVHFVVTEVAPAYPLVVSNANVGSDTQETIV